MEYTFLILFIMIIILVCCILDRVFVIERKVEDSEEVAGVPRHCDRCDKRIPSLTYSVKCHSAFYTDVWYLCDTCYDAVEDTLLNPSSRPIDTRST